MSSALAEAELFPAIDPAVVEADSLAESLGETSTEPVADSPAGLRVDTLSESVLILLVMTVVQRLTGFVRSILFCRWLEPEDLGAWDMAQGFLVVAAPLAVLGLPGSFGRYLEYYRQRGQLQAMLRRTTLASFVLALVAVVAIFSLRPWLSQVVFGTPDETHLVALLAGALLTVIAYNFFVELLTALRMFRLVSWMQFGNSIAFAVISLGLLRIWKESLSVILGYALACGASCLILLPRLRTGWRNLPADTAMLSHSTLWGKLVPFAAWMWVLNLLSNLFDMADRYMIVHYTVGTPEEALAQVGHYHSSRVLPLLMASVAMMIGSMLLPHLSHDWEAGRRREVSQRLNLTLKLLGLLMLAGSVAVLWIAPVLFGVAFANKYAGGLVVLPLTLIYCSWLGLGSIAHCYLWCAERAYLGCLAMFAGLAINVSLSMLWLPTHGLIGVVWATTLANLAALTLIVFFAWRLGMKVHPATVGVLLLPLLLALGSAIAAVALAVVGLAAVCTNQVLHADEKAELAIVGRRFVGRWWPSHAR